MPTTRMGGCLQRGRRESRRRPRRQFGDWVAISRQFGLPYIPLIVMEQQQLIEKHAKEAGLDVEEARRNERACTRLGGGRTLAEQLDLQAAFFAGLGDASGQATQAAAMFDEVERSIASGDVAKVERALSDMNAKFGSSPYAQQAGLLAAKTFYVGSWGNAAKMKLVTNLVLGLNRAALAEGLMFAEATGFTREDALQVLLNQPADSLGLKIAAQTNRVGRNAICVLRDVTRCATAAVGALRSKILA